MIYLHEHTKLRLEMNRWAILVLASLFSSATLAGDVIFERAWARATPPGAANGAVYGLLTNRGTTNEVLVSVSTDAAKMAMVHQTRHSENMTHMDHAERMSLAPGDTIQFKPGGTHVMLMGLKHALDEGGEVRVRFRLESGDDIDVIAKVGGIGQQRYSEE